MKIQGSIRHDIQSIHRDMRATVKHWNTVLYNLDWPACCDQLSPGDRIELAQLARRVASLDAASRILEYVINVKRPY